MTTNAAAAPSKFLGVIPRRYLDSYIGMLHGTSSFVALIVGNYLFLNCFLLRNDILLDDDSFLPSIFHVATALSGEYTDFDTDRISKRIFFVIILL